MRKNRRFRQKCEKIVLLYIKKKRKKKKSVLFDIIVKILLLPWGLAFKNILFRNNHIFASLKKSFNDLMMKSIVLYHVLILTQQNTQRSFNFDVCSNNVTNNFHQRVPTLIQRRLESGLTLKTIFFLSYNAQKNYNLYINVKKTTVFQRRKNFIFFKLKSTSKLTMKTRLNLGWP